MTLETICALLAVALIIVALAHFDDWPDCLQA